MTKAEEKKAHEEYLRLLDTLLEMSGWSGSWEDTKVDGVTIPGDKKRFLKEWSDNLKIFGDSLDLVSEDNFFDDEYF